MDYLFKTIRILLVVTCFGAMSASAQVLCGVKDTVRFDRIFGEDKLLVKGFDTLYISGGKRIIYSCWTCDITCLNSENRELWRRDLSGLGCRLLGFKKMPIKANRTGKSEKLHVFIQTNNKRIFVLKVRSGKLKQVKW